jgi:hypothetical protein
MSVYGKSQVQSQMIIPEHYRNQQNLNRRLKREAKQEDKAAEDRRKAWDMTARTPILITLHSNQGRIPGGVRLQIDNSEVPRWVIYRRAATPTGDLEAMPDAVLETVEFDDFSLHS